jgi:tetratricopeptide (TPR) repeat protein
MKRSIRFSLSIVGPLLLLACNVAPLHSQTANGISHEERDLGQRLYQEGRYSDALAARKKAVKRNKADADAWYYLGLTHLRKKDFKAATKAFESTLRLNPASANAHSGLAYSYFLRNKLNDSLSETERAIAIDAKHLDAHFILGMTKLHLGARDEALKEAEIVIKLNDKYAAAYLLKSQALVQFSGDILLQEKDGLDDRYSRYEEAAAALATYLKLSPDSDERQQWSDQLAALNFHLSLRSKEERHQIGVYNGREVTTKARLIYRPEPSYTETARKNDVTGTVILRCLFAADATIKHIVVVSGLPDGLTWVAVGAAKKIKFLPATLNGQPVSMILQLEYNFHLY